MKKILGAALILAFVTPALAADEFWVVQDVKTKKCTIVDKKPMTTEVTVVGDGKVFVMPVEEAYRVRTGEAGEEILQAHPDAATATA